MLLDIDSVSDFMVDFSFNRLQRQIKYMTHLQCSPKSEFSARWSVKESKNVKKPNNN